MVESVNLLLCDIHLLYSWIEDRFVDENGGKYNPSIVRVGSGQSLSVANVSLKNQVDAIFRRN